MFRGLAEAPGPSPLAGHAVRRVYRTGSPDPAAGRGPGQIETRSMSGAMRYTVILVPDDDGQVSVLVPALPGCASVGGSRHEALEHARQAIAGWLATEAAASRAPLVETTRFIEAGVRDALQ